MVARVEDLSAGRAVPVQVCDADTFDLGPGRHQVDVEVSDTFIPDSLVLSDGDHDLADSVPVQRHRPGAGAPDLRGQR